MTKRLRIELGGRTLYADLCVREAPHTVAAIEAAGRFETVLFNAQVCYGEVTFNTPVDDYWLEENVQEETRPGDVTFYNDWSSVCVFTREMEQYGPGPKFAQVRPEDLPAFQEVADECWHHPGMRLACEVVDVDDETGEESHRGPASPQQLPATPAVARMRMLLGRIWTERPRELDEMVARNASTGREFGAYAYAWGQFVHISDFLVVLMRMAREKNGSVRTLRAVAAETLRYFSPMVASEAHMRDAALVLEEAAGYFGTVEDYDSFVALTRAVQRWSAQMSFWMTMELPLDVMSEALHEAWNGAGKDRDGAHGHNGKKHKHGKKDGHGKKDKHGKKHKGPAEKDGGGKRSGKKHKGAKASKAGKGKRGPQAKGAPEPAGKADD